MKGSWNEFAGKLQEQIGGLIDNDLLFEEGTDKKRLGILQQQLGSVKEKQRKGNAKQS
jgi:uncharacterized protein YjbJ (UPF0337 family)